MAKLRALTIVIPLKPHVCLTRTNRKRKEYDIFFPKYLLSPEHHPDAKCMADEKRAIASMGVVSADEVEDLGQHKYPGAKSHYDEFPAE